MRDWVKVLHCADLHLGAAFAGLDKRTAAARRTDFLRTFREIVRICAREQVELLLIAGDLFDHVRVPGELLDQVRTALETIPSTTVAIAPGNHDPASVDSPYFLQDFWPQNVVLFQQGRLTAVPLPELGVCLWGAAFSGAYAHTSLLDDSVCPEGEWINICVLHGELLSVGQESDYNPIAPAQLLRCGMDYVALGHLHKRTPLNQAGNTYYAYPGCPEGRGFHETGEKGVYIGEISRTGCRMEFRPICHRQYLDLAVDVSGALNPRDAAAQVLARMEQTMGQSFADHLYRVRMQGSVDENAYLSPAAVREELEERDVFYAKVADETCVLLPESPGVAAEFSLRGVFLRKAGEAMAGGGEEHRYREALKLGLRAFAGKVEYHED